MVPQMMQAEALVLIPMDFKSLLSLQIGIHSSTTTYLDGKEREGLKLRPIGVIGLCLYNDDCVSNRGMVSFYSSLLNGTLDIARNVIRHIISKN